MSPKLIVGLGMMVAVVALAPLAVADGVVVSGQCYNADGSEGGKERTGVTTDEGVLVPRVADADGSGGAAVEALATFAVGTIRDGGATGGACDNADDEHRADYLAVDVNAAGQGAEVCYKGTVFAGANQDACSENPEGFHCGTDTNGDGIPDSHCPNGGGLPAFP